MSKGRATPGTAESPRLPGAPGAALHELSTPRLRLRAWRGADRAPFAAMNADPEVMAYFVSTLTRAESEAFVDRIEAGFAERGWGLWAVERRDTGTFCGYVGLQPVTFEAAFTPAVEIGWRLARAQWGQGFATEAARSVLGFGAGCLGLARIDSFTAVHNTRSEAVMVRIGMHKAGEFDHPRIAEGHPLRRHVLYERTASTTG